MSDDFDTGMGVEKACFAECLNHPQREALIHIFFAERAANKIPGLAVMCRSWISKRRRWLALAPWAEASPCVLPMLGSQSKL